MRWPTPFRKACAAATVFATALPGVLSASNNDSLQSFMREMRTPFLRNSSGVAEGTIQHRGPDGTRRMAITVRFDFTPGGSAATAELQDGRSCRMVWRHGKSGSAQIVEQSGDGEQALRQLGLRPSDLTFSFLFWTVAEERRPETVAGQPCRVVLLRRPDSGERVLGWFSEKFRFPLRLEWYPNDSDRPERVCEFVGFKKQSDGRWFLKTLRIYGDDWKTKVAFDEVAFEKKVESRHVP